MALALTRQRTFGSIYTLGFFFALVNALPTYINSEFLSQFVGPQSVGVIYSISSLIALILFLNIGRLLKRFGDFKIAMSLGLTCFIALLGLATLTEPFTLAVLFVAFDVAGVMLYFSIDIFLETTLTNNVTGTVRGTFLSIANTAWIMAPVIAGLILSFGNYANIYMVSLAVLIPVLVIISSGFSKFKDSEYENVSMFKIITAIPKHKSTSKILATNFLLQFFYAVMVIYSPIYLKTYMGFEWQTIGLIFTIMLFPFAILEAPLGRLADERWGEKEMLSVGFVIMGLSTILLTFIPIPDFWLWAAGLLATRIGASTVEIMNETYFFKKTGENQPEVVSLFRMTKPLAYIIAPLVATFVLQLMPFKALFFMLGLVMFYGLRYSLTLKDTL
jgi:MFS family permease